MKSLIAVLVVVSMLGIQFHLTRVEPMVVYKAPAQVLVISCTNQTGRPIDDNASSYRAGKFGTILVQRGYCVGV